MKEIVRILSKDEAVLEDGIKKAQFQINEYERGLRLEKLFLDACKKELVRIRRNHKPS